MPPRAGYEEELLQQYKETLASIDAAETIPESNPDITNAGKWSRQYAKLWRQRADDMWQKLLFMMDTQDIQGLVVAFQKTLLRLSLWVVGLQRQLLQILW